MRLEYRILKYLWVLILIPQISQAQTLSVSDKYLKIDASGDDPLYTTYTATISRSRLYGDKGYKMDYYTDCEPLNYSSDNSGRMFAVWIVNKLAIMNIGQFFQKPVVTASFPDMAILEYQPFPGIKVQETFFVYSSTVAMVQMVIKNVTAKQHLIDIYPILELGNDSLAVIDFISQQNTFITHHFESKKRLISNLYTNAPYPTNIRNVFTVNFLPYSFGGYNGSIEEFYNIIKTDWYDEDRVDSLNRATSGFVNFVTMHQRFSLEPGETKEIRYFRGWQGQDENVNELHDQVSLLKSTHLQSFLNYNIDLFKSVPRIDFDTKDEKLIYLGAFNLSRGSMLPPSGKTSYNYYVFSRNPKWGWGHGHQVLHESLSMMAYAYLDATSAQNSQRVYMEQQGKDGLIAYRHGPRGPQTYPHKGKPTTSSPFFSWINWEIYQVSMDYEFLEEAYDSGTRYLEWLIKNRDTDKDGLFEWGPYGLIENVRDWYNVIFQVSKERHLDIDKEDISDELECLDLSLMIVKEMRCLSKMAAKLGRKNEAKKWSDQADQVSALINEVMWDEETGFYYHIDKVNHTFKFMDRDLKRAEIIGFLPLWAEAAPKERADQLLKRLTDTTQFWRKYGVPTLSADDPYYSPYVDYCCKWNGPVWLLWDYMVFEGLINYGHTELASQLADKMILAVKTQLSLNHNYWESYSPDNDVLNCPTNYIWDAIMAKLLIEVYGD